MGLDFNFSGLWSEIVWPLLLALFNASRLLSFVVLVVGLLIVLWQWANEEDKDNMKGKYGKRILILIVVFVAMYSLKTIVSFFGINSNSFSEVQ